MTAFLHANQVADVKQFAWPVYSTQQWLTHQLQHDQTSLL